MDILSENRRYFRNNNLNPASFQYVPIEIPRVVEGTYRLTVYTDGVFGDFVQDDIRITVPKTSGTGLVPRFVWKEESAGAELWRIESPYKSVGEFKGWQ